MRHAWHIWLSLFLFPVLLQACASESPSESGEDDIGVDCATYSLDGGGFSQDAPEYCLFQDPEMGVDAGPCAPLEDLYCGVGGECQDSPSCVAVRLMKDAPDSGGICEGLAMDAGEFVVCIDIQLCEALVQKTCGVSPEAVTDETVCRQRPACQQALAYYDALNESDGGGYSTAQFCAQALQEPSVFPACSEE